MDLMLEWRGRMNASDLKDQIALRQALVLGLGERVAVWTCRKRKYC